VLAVGFARVLPVFGLALIHKAMQLLSLFRSRVGDFHCGPNLPTLTAFQLATVIEKQRAKNNEQKKNSDFDKCIILNC
jgi:hypothetical protein